MKFRDFRNYHEMLKETVEKNASQEAYRWSNSDGTTESVTWETFYDQARRAARSLMALGVNKSDKVTILSYSCYRWVLTDAAAMISGTATVGIYQSLLADDCQYIIDHSDSVLAFVEDELQMEKLLETRDRLPKIRKVILFSGVSPDKDWVITFEDFLNIGESVSEEDLDGRIDQVSAEDTAAIVYTSGTTGVPKGAVLTHDNITFTAQSVEGSMVWKPGDHVFLFLPLAHVFARTTVYTTVLVGCTMTFNRSMETLAENLKAARPHWFPSVPRVYEKVYAKILGGVQAKGGAALKIFKWAMQVGNAVSEAKLSGQPIPLLTRMKYRLAVKLVFSKIQDALGGRVRWCISGAAPLNPEIGRFFHAAGVLIVEGIGMTENTSFSNINRFDNYRFGWVGQPGPGVEQKIGPDGEVLFKGRNIMKEYYKMPEETTDAISPDGWLHTGDLGEIDGENFLKITGRKKELIVTSGGKNIAPAAIEGHLGTSQYILQACVIGDGRNYLTALITIDPDNVAAYAESKGISFSNLEELLTEKEILDLIEGEIVSKNKELPTFETIKNFKLVPEFTIENGLLTPTLKTKKNVVMQQYSREIDGLYEKER